MDKAMKWHRILPDSYMKKVLNIFPNALLEYDDINCTLYVRLNQQGGYYKIFMEDLPNFPHPSSR